MLINNSKKIVIKLGSSTVIDALQYSMRHHVADLESSIGRDDFTGHAGLQSVRAMRRRFFGQIAISHARTAS